MRSRWLLPGWKRVEEGTPQGWRAVQLGSFTRTVAGGRLRLTKEQDYRPSGFLAYSAAGQDGFVSEAEFTGVDAVIVSSVGAQCGKCFLAEGSWTTLANVQAVIPNASASARFLHYRLNRDDYWPRSGSAQPFIKPSDIGRCWVELPPLPEQRRIAEILDTLDETIRKTEQLIAKLKQVKQGLLHDLLTRGIDDNGELRDPERHPEQFANTPLGQLPTAWQVATADRLCLVLTVGVVNAATHAYVPEGIPFIRSQNVKPNRVDTCDVLFVTHGFNQQQRKSILHEGDVIVVRTGYPGTAAVVPAALEGANCFSLVIARPDPARLGSTFFSQYLNSDDCKRLINSLQFGSAQHNFNVGVMRDLAIPVPPLAEQVAIGAAVAAQEERIEGELKTQQKLELFKSGLMEDLLTGRVRVTDFSGDKAA